MIYLINIKTGKQIKGKLKPSTDAHTFEIYKSYKDIKALHTLIQPTQLGLKAQNQFH